MIEQLRPLQKRPADRPTIVGLSGGIGTGKSSLAHALGQLGAALIDIDEISRSLFTTVPAVKEQVIAAFGQEILDTEGEISRPALAAIVFSDPGARRTLEHITHPAIEKIQAQRLAAIETSQVAVLDVPLLVETCNPADFDLIIMVDAGLEIRLERLAKRGLAREDTLARMASQATREERRGLAHLWVTNDGAPRDLENDARTLWRRYLSNQSEQWPRWTQ